jgi:hypothetical protein
VLPLSETEAAETNTRRPRAEEARRTRCESELCLSEENPRASRRRPQKRRFIGLDEGSNAWLDLAMVREVWEETERVRDDCILRIFQAGEREREARGGERSEGLKYSWVFGSRGERALISPLRV